MVTSSALFHILLSVSLTFMFTNVSVIVLYELLKSRVTQVCPTTSQDSNTASIYLAGVVNIPGWNCRPFPISGQKASLLGRGC